MRIFRTAAAVCLLVFAPSPAAGVTLSIATVSGDSVFFAPPGDTVTVAVTLDSAGDSLTGIELFLAYDPRRFAAVDASADPGLQPGASADALGDVFADSLIEASDSLAIVHFAEVDLDGKVVSGTVMTVQLEVIAGLPGVSPIALHENGAQSSLYTVLGQEEGATMMFEPPAPLHFSDLPPVLQLPAALSFDEDGTLTVALAELATDEAGSALLAWEVTAEPGVTVNVAAGTLTLTGAADFNGEIQLTFEARDPAGTATSGSLPLTVAALNDPPRITPGTLPDSVVLTGGSAEVTLRASDVDDVPSDLVWTVTVDSPVVVSVTATEAGSTARFEAPLDWTGTSRVQVAVTDPDGAVDTVSLIAKAAGEVPPPRAGDFDGNGAVDFQDFVAFAGSYGKPDADPMFDLDADGSVGFGDFVRFAQAFGG